MVDFGRHKILGLAMGLVLALTSQATGASPATADDDPIDLVMTEEWVLRDPNIPAAGNPDGDITIVEYLDVQCPYCKKVHADLTEVAKEDGKIRIVYKEWPIFGGVSVYAAKLVQAARYQNKYVEAHDAVITAKSKLTEDGVRDLLAKAGVDVPRAEADLKANAKEIDSTLARNALQARAFDFKGTPSFIIGKFRVPGALDAALIKRAVADARAAKQGK